MATKDKLIERFKKLPEDFTFDELITLLSRLGYVASTKGKTSGSRIRFQNSAIKSIIDVHKPHTKGAPIKERLCAIFTTN
ncbi:MAG: type II toxin-antitoxin system HicA family toxin [Tannerella sp.]|jgi:hypothetical protein|nr:type II toxin-antitoxin system HicA family toxin [Tannerella sp.]